MSQRRRRKRKRRREERAEEKTRQEGSTDWKGRWSDSRRQAGDSS